jgi:hypothetical protein
LRFACLSSWQARSGITFNISDSINGNYATTGRSL